MPLEPGTKLGPYLIQEQIGSGGMGVVYKAWDSRLERTVAIKVIDGKFTERFEREAKTIASVSHAHICTLYDIGDNYLVMEYIEGKPLKGPLPLDEVIRLGAQIAEALGEAHGKRVVHRDLKPGNILVNNAGVKVIDFGLAKAIVLEHDPGDATLSAPLTVDGTLMGTVPYMSPEQLQCKEADARSDIFAFGCVLYEMVTGKRAFGGKSQVSIMAAIMEREPEPLGQVKPGAPAWLEKIIRRCIRKKPDERWQSARDIAIELREPHTEPVVVTPAPSPEVAPPPPPPPPPPVRKPTREWVGLAVLGLATLAMGVYAFRPQPRVEKQNFWVSMLPPEGTQLVPGAPRLSPDGRMIAIMASREGKSGIYVRPLDLPTWRMLAGTEGAFGPFWSPDSRNLAFAARGKLRRVDIATGQVRTICDASTILSGSWSVEGRMLFSGQAGQLGIFSVFSVADTGGEPVALPDSGGGGGQTRSVEALPNGGFLLNNGLGLFAATTLNAKPQLISSISFSNFHYVPGDTGHLLSGRGTRLFARSFDPRRLTVGDNALPIIDGVDSQANANRFHFSTSATGALAYAPSERLRRRLQWVNRKGEPSGEFGEPGEYDYLRVSPDGKHIAYSVRDADSGEFRSFIVEADGSRIRPLGYGPYSIRHHCCPKQLRSAAFPQPNRLIRRGTGGHHKTRSLFPRSPCPKRRAGAEQETVAQNLPQRALDGLAAAIQSCGGGPDPSLVCPKRDVPKAV